MIAIIPARGGSKGVPRKNIKDLCGKPLIAYTIEAALNADGIERVIVNTDDEEIATVAKQYGAEVPFLRPAELATDTAMAVDVYIHTIEYLMKETGKEINKFMVLLPTAPLRMSEHIECAMELFFNEGATSLVSMTPADTPVTWYYKKNEVGRVENAGFGSGDAIANRQVAEQYFVPNGAIYILDYKLLKEKRTYYSDDTVAYVMSAESSIDIDTMFDFEMASFILQRNRDKE